MPSRQAYGDDRSSGRSADVLKFSPTRASEVVPASGSEYALCADPGTGGAEEQLRDRRIRRGGDPAWRASDPGRHGDLLLDWLPRLDQGHVDLHRGSRQILAGLFAVKSHYLAR